MNVSGRLIAFRACKFRKPDTVYFIYISFEKKRKKGEIRRKKKLMSKLDFFMFHYLHNLIRNINL